MGETGAERHRARERALEIFYEATIKGRSVAAVINEQAVRPDEYAIAVLWSAESHQAQAETLISAHSIDWPLDRLAVIDRLVMTMAIGEMLMEGAPPMAVILDEAVELAKVYSTDGSGAFVNGVLSSIAKEILE